MNKSESKTINLLFAGDFIPPETKNNIYSDGLREILKDKDISIVNLETPLTLSNSPIDKLGNNFKRHPEAIKHIIDGYIDAVICTINFVCIR